MSEENKIEGTFSWSADEERFHGKFATRDEAIAGARTYYGDAAMPIVIFTGSNNAHSPMFRGAAHEALETLLCQADDECGEVAEDWELLDPKILDAVEQAIRDIVMREAPPGFWYVDDIQRHENPHPFAAHQSAPMETGNE